MSSDYLNYVKTVFKLSGYLPSQKFWHTYILKYVFTPIMSGLILLVLYNFREMHNDIFEIAAILQSFSTHGHVFGRKLSILKHAPMIETLINDRKHFWKYGLFGEKLEDSFRKKMTLRNFIIKSLTGISVVMLLYFFLTPVFTGEDLPQAAWIPRNRKIWKIFIYFFQVFCVSESLHVAVIIDGSFLLMCGEMEIQFVLLKKCLNSLKIGKNCSYKHEELCFNKLRFFSKYHNFLLREHEKMKTVFSEFFLLQFLLSVEGLCIEIFVFNKAQTRGQFALAVIYIVGIIMQSSFTFLAASYLESEAETLANAIFAIDWYNAKTAKIPKHILFMLMKAQKPLRLKGAGLFDVNRNALLQIFRTGFSISAIIKRL